MTVPRVFKLPHLSEDAVAAFADGVLAQSAAGRAQRHCLECPECADAVRGQREAAMMLRTAGAPSLPAGLLDRLAGLPMSAPLPPRRSGLPTTLNSEGVAVFVAYRPIAEPAKPSDPQRGQTQNNQHHRRVLLPIVASAAAVVAAGAIGGSVSSFQPSTGQPVISNFAVNNGSTGTAETGNQRRGRTALDFSGGFEASAALLLPQQARTVLAVSPRYPGP
jgi:hypothetical protein